MLNDLFCNECLNLAFLHFPSILSLLTDNPSLLRHVSVTVQVLDMNDNPPEIATNKEVIVCESSKPGQVRVWNPSRGGKKKLNTTYTFPLSHGQTFFNFKKKKKLGELHINHCHFPERTSYRWTLVSLSKFWVAQQDQSSGSSDCTGKRLLYHPLYKMSNSAADHDSSKSKLVPICSQYSLIHSN